MPLPGQIAPGSGISTHAWDLSRLPGFTSACLELLLWRGVYVDGPRLLATHGALQQGAVGYAYVDKPLMLLRDVMLRPELPYRALSIALQQLAVYPLETLNRKVVYDAGRASPKYAGTLDCIVQTYKEEGIAGFFHGFFANLVYRYTEQVLLTLLYKAKDGYLEWMYPHQFRRAKENERRWLMGNPSPRNPGASSDDPQRFHRWTEWAILLQHQQRHCRAT